MEGRSAPLVVAFAVVKVVGESPAASNEDRNVAVLADLVSGHNGDLVKTLSNGVMAVFRSPADGVSCALAMQGAIRNRADQGITLQIGLSFGEPLVEGDDYFGTPVVVARRLCDRADAGQILCASLISRFESVRARAAFRSIGPLELKGITTPVPASEVRERGAGADAASDTPGAR